MIVATALAFGHHVDITLRTWPHPTQPLDPAALGRQQWYIHFLLADHSPLALENDIGTLPHNTFQQALSDASSRLTTMLEHRAATGPTDLITAPQQPHPLHLNLDQIDLHLPRVARHYTSSQGVGITARFNRHGCHLLLHATATNTSDPDAAGTILGTLATAPTLAQAITQLPLDHPNSDPPAQAER